MLLLGSLLALAAACVRCLLLPAKLERGVCIVNRGGAILLRLDIIAFALAAGRHACWASVVAVFDRC